MVLALEVMNGPLLGQKLQIHEGFRIGRREGHLRLEHDVKVSGVHAIVELDNKGQLVLMDQKSANALVINQRRVRKIALIPGVLFRVGETEIKVVEISSAEAEAVAPTKSWKEQLQESFALVHPQPEKAREVHPLTPALILDFIQGIQAENEVVLAYGPRVAGMGHLDIDLHEPDCPDRAFEISAGLGVPYLRDLTGGRLKINRESVQDVHPLQEGDIIAIGQTRIRVRFV